MASVSFKFIGIIKGEVCSITSQLNIKRGTLREFLEDFCNQHGINKQEIITNYSILVNGLRVNEDGLDVVLGEGETVFIYLPFCGG